MCCAGAAGWWIRDWGWRYGTSTLATPPADANASSWIPNQLIGGMQIACMDSCHTGNLLSSQLPYMYGCQTGASANLSYAVNQGYNSFSGDAYDSGHTSFNIKSAPIWHYHSASCL